MDGKAIFPGATLGMLGGGQLGRMFAAAATRLGYRVAVYCPEEDPPAGHVGNSVTRGDYSDTDKLKQFAKSVDVVTLEFENIPVLALETLSAFVPVRPHGAVLHVTQNRLREKRFLQGAGFPVTPFIEVSSAASLRASLAELGGSVIVKTAEWGYDGKGQRAVLDETEVDRAWEALGFPGQICIAEKRIELQSEVSCIVARSATGELQVVGVFGNTHTNHILDTTVFPAPLPLAQAARVEEISRAIAQALDYVGVLCVEFFLDGSDEVMVNELAPRPHNSGHVTIEAVSCSQFEQQVRAICGLPLGSSQMVSPGAMVNLLGDLWGVNGPRYDVLGRFPEAHLHLYGKSEARPGRKMGHITVLGRTADDAAATAQQARQAFASG